MLYEIQLQSSDPQRLFNFLSFLFDIELIENNGEVISFVFAVEKTPFVISQSNNVNRALSFSLRVPSPELLSDYKSKFELYCYKNGLSVHSIDLKEDRLEFEDFETSESVVEDIDFASAFLLNTNPAQFSLDYKLSQ